MDLGIRDRVALVAASSRGLGFEVARSLAAEGVRVVICGRDEERLQEAAARLRRDDARVLAVACDLTVEEQVTSLVAQARQHFGQIDILVANCGGPPSGQFLQHDSQAWRQAVQLNLMSTVFLCRQVVPQMQERGWGRVVLMTSITVKQPLENLVLSNSVRAAVVGLGKTLAAEMGPSGVLVNSVCPGYFLTDRVSGLAEAAAARTGESPQAFIDSWARQGVLGRIGDPAEFAPLVAFLCSERASYITGTALAIDGGLSRSLL